MSLVNHVVAAKDAAVQVHDEVLHIAQYVKVGRINVALDELRAAISHLDNARRHLQKLADGEGV